MQEGSDADLVVWDPRTTGVIARERSYKMSIIRRMKDLKHKDRLEWFI